MAISFVCSGPVSNAQSLLLSPVLTSSNAAEWRQARHNLVPLFRTDKVTRENGMTWLQPPPPFLSPDIGLPFAV